MNKLDELHSCLTDRESQRLLHELATLRNRVVLAETLPIEVLAHWMVENGFATGHGDGIDDLLKELSWQVKELRSHQP